MTMLLPSFTLHLPASIKETVKLLSELEPEGVDVMAGGSDLLCNYKWGLNPKPHVIGLRNVAELSGIEAGRIGAATTLRELSESEVARRAFPVVADAASRVASVLIRERATVGGNLLLDTRCHFFNQSWFWRTALGNCLKAEGSVCHVVPKVKRDGKLVDNCFECYATNSSDLAPALMVLGAELEFISASGTRRVPLAQFYAVADGQRVGGDGIKRNDKAEGELLVAVHLPRDAASMRAGYKKLSPRQSWDFPVLGVAAAIRKDQGGKLDRFSLAVNAVHSVPESFDERLRVFLGKPLDDASIDAVAEMVRTGVQPKLTVPMEPGYRKKMAGVFTRKLLKELARV